MSYGVTQTIQAVCTDGQRHKDSPRNPDAGGPDRTMMPCREPALAQPDQRKSLDCCQAPLGAKGIAYEQWQPPPPKKKSPDANISIYHPDLFGRNHVKPRRKGPLSRTISVTGATHISLLCISSMRSVKRTSLFLSQKPSAS